MKYLVHAIHSGTDWVLEVPELPGVFTQARTLEEAPAMAREAVALMLDVPESDVEVEVLPVG